MQFLDKAGLNYLVQKVKNLLANKVNSYSQEYLINVTKSDNYLQVTKGDYTQTSYYLKEDRAIYKFSISSSMSLSTANELEQVKLDTTEVIRPATDTSFDLYGGEIIVLGDNVSAVELSGFLQQNGSGSPYYTVRLFKNGTQISSIRLYGEGGYHSLILNNDIVAVEKGDVLQYQVSVSDISKTVNAFQVLIREI